MKKVLVVGVFDLIHRGHVELFRRARQYGDHLTVWVHADEYIKKAGCILPTKERLYMCNAIRYVDRAVPYGNLDEDIVHANFDVLVAGEDQIGYPHFVFARKWCEEHGKEFVILERTVGISSSQIKRKIASNISPKDTSSR